MNKQKLILSLIKDDLINLKLVSGLLDHIDLNAENNFLHLSKTIFHLMDFDDNKQDEKLYQSYLALIKKVVPLDISNSHKPLDDLTLKIYQELVAIKSLNN